jgi:hypothetical protein
VSNEAGEETRVRRGKRGGEIGREGERKGAGEGTAPKALKGGEGVLCLTQQRMVGKVREERRMTLLDISQCWQVWLKHVKISLLLSIFTMGELSLCSTPTKGVFMEKTPH